MAASALSPVGCGTVDGERLGWPVCLPLGTSDGIVVGVTVRAGDGRASGALGAEPPWASWSAAGLNEGLERGRRARTADGCSRGATLGSHNWRARRRRTWRGRQLHVHFGAAVGALDGTLDGNGVRLGRPVGLVVGTPLEGVIRPSGRRHRRRSTPAPFPCRCPRQPRSRRRRPRSPFSPGQLGAREGARFGAPMGARTRIGMTGLRSARSSVAARCGGLEQVFRQQGGSALQKFCKGFPPSGMFLARGAHARKILLKR